MNKYGGYINATYGNVGGVKSSYSPSASQKKATSGVTTKTVRQNNDFNTLWNKYGAQLVGSDTKLKATGPNAEIAKTTVQQKEEALKKKYTEYLTGTASQAGSWGVPKTIKDGAQPKQPANTAPKAIVPNTEIGKTFANISASNQYSSKDLVRRWINELSDNKGPNRESVDTVKTAKDTTVYPTYLGPNAETSRTNYLDHSDYNPLEILNDKIKQKTENSDNYLLKTPEQTEDYDIIVTKDNVQYIPLSEDEKLIRDIADEVEKELRKLKIQKAEIELNQRYSLGMNGEIMSTYDVDMKIEKAAQILDIINYYEDAKSEEIKKYLISLENNGVYNELNSDNDLNDIYPKTVKAKQSFDRIDNKTNPYLSPFDKLIMEKGENDKYVIKVESDFSKKFSFEVKSIGEEYGVELYKIAVDKVDYDKLNYTQEAIISKINNAVITESQLNELQKIIKTGKKLGRISEAMDTIGKGFDLWELGTIIEKDRADDGRLEKQSVQQAAKLTGELIGETAGTAIGVPLGAAAGLAVGGPLGTAVGIMAGPVIASSVMSELSGLLAEYLGGETYDWEYSAHQHERWK